MIRLQDARIQRVGGTAIQLPDLDLAGGERTVVLTGPSGCGKSTCIQTAAGVLPGATPARRSGVVQVAGHDPAHLPPRQRSRHVGWMGQDLHMVTATPWDEVALPLQHAGWKRGDARHRIESLLAVLDLPGDAPAETLSGGQKARVVLAAAAAAEPKVLLLDEPLAQLDLRWRERGRRLIESVPATRLVASHRLECWPGARLHQMQMADAAAAAIKLPSHDGDEVASLEAASLPDRGVDLPSLALRRGEAVAVTGDNGAGKTTLLWCLAGLLRVPAIEAQIGGVAPGHGNVLARARRVGMAFQDPAWHVTQDTVWEEATLTLRNLGMDTAPARAWLERFDLWRLHDRHPWDLSGGERQRLAVVTAMAHGPELVLLDEPTRGMDASARHRLLGAIAARAQAGKVTVVATHDDGLAGMMHRTVRVGGTP